MEEKRAEALLDAMYEEMQREKREAAGGHGGGGGGTTRGMTRPSRSRRSPRRPAPGGDAVASTPKPVASKRGPERPETPTLPPPMESEEAAETYRAVVRSSPCSGGEPSRTRRSRAGNGDASSSPSSGSGEETSGVGGGDVGPLGASR